MNRSLLLFYADKNMIQYSIDEGFKVRNKFLVKEVPYSIYKIDDDSFMVGEEHGLLQVVRNLEINPGGKELRKITNSFVIKDAGFIVDIKRVNMMNNIKNHNATTYTIQNTHSEQQLAFGT